METNSQDSREGSSTSIQVARRIVSDIVDMGWPVGRWLGSEAQLIERYNTSRASFRQATRLLEQWRVAMMRPGRKGGLVVIASEPSAATYSTALNLRFNKVPIGELYDSRMVLEVANLERAIKNLDKDSEAELDAIISFYKNQNGVPFQDGKAHVLDIHSFLARRGGLRPLELFTNILVELNNEYSRWAGFDISALHETAQAHVLIAEAVRNRDFETAKRRLCKHLDAVCSWLEVHREDVRLPE